MDTSGVSSRAAARLRRTFKYPAEDDGEADLSPDEMDEEEQEHLLSKLQASESASNRQYTLILTGLPLIVVLLFLRYLFASTTASMAMLCLLSITSLLASSYIMYFIPIITSADTDTNTNSAPSSRRTPSSVFATANNDNGIGKASSFSLSSIGRNLRQRQLPAGPLLTFANGDMGGPIERYLPTLNAAISLLLFFSAMAYRSKGRNRDGAPSATTSVPEGLWMFLLLPGLVFVMVYVAKRSMGDIQSGLRELQGLRYEYKGA
ncbi:hypothetical protein HRR83_009177 [Exophiala dermatitidis]|uniref:Uncharacterized protein n=1 Tax=Exophiala dermatitidis TaxID=5970 RepID=A0AAN6ESY4_EXODE|nr:hypothetical protein HRR75_008586 [Exophiala dermatitidis]KAJ4503008.1 hypothetical protein HRR73_009282 [Exophiala dermatitidis]KAJ4503431.1 hypothetical protein HRR74_009338 [Exophiala dermatitidis]KAJ4535452.1 hypothetical protein HRR77_008067 [Exophiala dermatitidis]KAJ4540667.1 hypothetical protein HRR76_004055 [Exophiala dermatitidis]